MIPNRKPNKLKILPTTSVKSRVERSTKIFRRVPITQNKHVPTIEPKKGLSFPKRNPQIPVTSVKRIWNGETVFVIGGGPSLKTADWNKLAGKKTIAINKSFITYPNADVLYWTDSRFYSWYTEKVNEFKGLKYTIRHSNNYTGDINLLTRGRRYGLETRTDTLAHGNNSGYAAINLAYHLGAKKIVLLGYDMGIVKGESHYHDGYPIKATSHDIYEKQFIPGFQQLADELKQNKVEVWNACLTSNLFAFPKISLQRGLSFT